MGNAIMAVERRAQHNKINYIEFAASDFDKTKIFFTKVFGWEFTDYGPDYTAYEGWGMDCGFYRSDKTSSSDNGGALPVFFSENLEETERKVKAAGGSITKDIFSFPGGRRFQFKEPSGNELGVWTNIDEKGNSIKV